MYGTLVLLQTDRGHAYRHIFNGDAGGTEPYQLKLITHSITRDNHLTKISATSWCRAQSVLINLVMSCAPCFCGICWVLGEYVERRDGCLLPDLSLSAGYYSSCFYSAIFCIDIGDRQSLLWLNKLGDGWTGFGDESSRDMPCWVFTHLKLWITSARHNFKSVEIPSDEQSIVWSVKMQDFLCSPVDCKSIDSSAPLW